MSKRLFVGGLSYSITSETLKELFSEIGPVSSADVISDRETSQSKGFGFVEMQEDEDAQKAIDKFNNSEVEGRTLNVSIARPREERPRSNNRNFGNSRGGFGGRNDRDSYRRRD